MKKIKYIIIMILLLNFVNAYNYTPTYNYGKWNQTLINTTWNNTELVFKLNGFSDYCENVNEYYQINYTIFWNETEKFYFTYPIDGNYSNTNISNIGQDYYNITILKNETNYKLEKNCTQTGFQNYLDESVINYIDNYVPYVPQDIEFDGNIIAGGFVEADDIIIHSDGFRDLTFEELKTILLNLGNLQNGEINKSKVPEYYKTDDGNGIRMWRIMIDVVVNLAKHIYNWRDDIQPKIQDHDTKLDWIQNNGYTGTCGAFDNIQVQNGIIVGCN